MTPAGRKAKGRTWQNKVRDMIRGILKPWGVEDDDVKSTAMGQTGCDIQLSPKAKKLLPVAVECKSYKDIKTIYTLWNQARSNAISCEPVVALKANHKQPLAIISLDYYLSLELERIKNNT